MHNLFMDALAAEIMSLSCGKVGGLVRSRAGELRRNRGSEGSLFSELCFCILTANERAAKGIEIQGKIGSGFADLGQAELAEFLKKTGYRFYNVRASYIVDARAHYGKLGKTLATFASDAERREWLAKNVKGLGYKESSHFLRNTGFNGCAILDRHIVKLMQEHGMIASAPKTLARKNYIELEKKLEPLCSKTNMEQGILDFYLWYMKTGKILK
jgi:N-glycosylase/DNA lyase